MASRGFFEFEQSRRIFLAGSLIPNMALIELRKVSKRFGRLVVLDNVDLSVEEERSLVLVGASGTGKSVLLKHIVGLLKPD